MTSTHELRQAQLEDVPALQRFFEQAYGAQTVFKSSDFLLWFLGGPSRDPATSLNSFIALQGDRVVAHYGYIPTELQIAGLRRRHIWGVNAYTLPEVRGAGLGRELVDLVREQSDSFGVIGFTESTADFYASIGFNVFAKRRFRRHVLVLRPEIRDVLELIGTAQHAGAEKLATISPVDGAPPRSLSPLPAGICTPVRDRPWLDWRFSARSLLDYQTRSRGESAEHGVIAYRPVALPPTPHVMTRIVDLYGDPTAASELLVDVCREARTAGHIYVELSCLGTIYDEVLAALGFVVLADDEHSLLPMLTSPVAFKPNTEYVGISCRSDQDLTQALTADTVYFTVADSDRDRRGRLTG